MTRLIFINRFFYPDISATSQMLSDLVFGLAARGQTVEVITSRMCYDQPGTRLSAHETCRGVTVHRVPTTRLGRRNTFSRLLDYLTFYLSVCAYLLRHVQRGDRVVIKTDPPLLSVPAGFLARFKGAVTVNWLQDVFPEVMYAAGMQLGPTAIDHTIRRILLALRDRSLHKAAANVVLSEGMQAHLQARGIPAQRLTIIPNWADVDSITPTAADNNPLRAEWQLQNHFVVGYSGNMGVAHQFDAIMHAATALRNDPRIVFLLIGGGHHRTGLEAQVIERKLENSVRFMPYQPREQLSNGLGVADIHLVSLRPEMEGLIVPSKFYGIAAAGRPTIFIGDEHGEVAQVLREFECGSCVSNQQGDRLAALIQAYAVDSARCTREGENARALAMAQYTRVQACDAWEVFLSLLTPRRSPR